MIRVRCSQAGAEEPSILGLRTLICNPWANPTRIIRLVNDFKPVSVPGIVLYLAAPGKNCQHPGG